MQPDCSNVHHSWWQIHIHSLLGSLKQRFVENLVFQLHHGSAPIILVAPSLDRIENVFIEMRKVSDRCAPTMLAFSVLHPAVDAFTITSLSNVGVGEKAEPRNNLLFNNIELTTFRQK
jgi:hypothetical protein